MGVIRLNSMPNTSTSMNMLTYNLSDQNSMAAHTSKMSTAVMARISVLTWEYPIRSAMLPSSAVSSTCAGAMPPSVIRYMPNALPDSASAVVMVSVAVSPAATAVSAIGMPNVPSIGILSALKTACVMICPSLPVSVIVYSARLIRSYVSNRISSPLIDPPSSGTSCETCMPVVISPLSAVPPGLAISTNCVRGININTKRLMTTANMTINIIRCFSRGWGGVSTRCIFVFHGNGEVAFALLPSCCRVCSM